MGVTGVNTEIKFLGSLFNKGAHFAGAIFDKEFICPTLTTMQGGADSQ